MIETVKLPAGARAPIDSDCIRIRKLADGRYGLEASALDAEESVAIVSGGPYDTYEAAEAAGLAWAGEHGVRLLHVETPEA